MKSSFDLRHGIGKVKPENLDDLWVLNSIIQKGDKVKARTMRSVEVRRGDEKEKVGKKPVVLKIEVEKTELSDKLKIGGKIIEGPENVERSYHTIAVEPSMQITIEKDWKRWEVEKIKAARATVEPVLACILDEREADFYLIGNKINHLFELSGGHGKGFEKQKSAFYSEAAAEIIKKSEQVKHVIVAGPGFAKDNIKKILKDKKFSKNAIFDSVSHTGPPGLQELIRRGNIEKIVKSSRLTEETRAVEDFMEKLQRNGKVAYGREHVKEALEAGAAESLLVSDQKARELEELLELAEKTKCKIMLISSEHQSGQKLLGFGGVAAILRYEL